MNKVQAQVELLNDLLSEIYKLRNENKKNDDNDEDVLMIDKYNKKNKYFHFEINLLEMLPKPNDAVIYINKLFHNLSPQQIYLGYLRGNDTMTKYREMILYSNKNIDLLKMVTPNMTKNVWYLETDLVYSRLLKVYCIMNLMDMQNMLKTCPIPFICLLKSTYKIDDPDTFVKIIDKLKDAKKSLNFIPYLRQYSKENTINDKAVYYLRKIKLVDSNCF